MANAPFYNIGRHWGRITRQQLGETSTGKPQFVLTFLVVGMVDPKDPEGDLLPVAAEYERSIYRVITGKTIEFVLQDLETLGAAVPSFAMLDENHPQCCELRGKEMAFFCNHKPRQIRQDDGSYVATSEMREEWSLARDGGGPNVKPMDGKSVSKLDAMFGKSLKKLGSAPKPEPAPRQTPEKQTATVNINEALAEVDDLEDIPF